MGRAFGPGGLIRSALAEPYEQQSLPYEQHILPDGLAVRRLPSVGFAELVQALYPAQQTLQREINPVLYSAPELGERLDRGDAFCARVLSDSRIFVIGGPDELGELAGDRAPASARA